MAGGPVIVVGRGDEREAVLDALGQRGTGAVVLSGPAGVGKTCLARHCAERMASAGTPVVHVVASATTRNVPLGALARLLPDDRPIPERGVDALRVVADGILAIAATPFLLSIDDAHDLDAQSAWVVRDLAANGEVGVLATVRSGEACPEEIIDLWRSGLATRVDVADFDRATADAFTEQVLGGPVHPTLQERAWTASTGNALYLRELLLGARQSGAVEWRDGAWAAPRPLPTSARLVDVVEQRLRDLEDEQRRALELIAVAGTLGAAIAERLVAGHVLEELERRGHLRVDTDDRRTVIGLSHPLHGEVLRAALPLGTFRQLCRRLADALADTGARRRGDALRLATWRLDSGDIDPDLFTRAANAARFAGDHALAERLARTAWEHGRVFEALAVLVAVLGFLGRPEEAVRWAGEADVGALDEDQRTRLEILRAETLFWGLGRADDARSVIDAALGGIDHPDRRHELLAARAAYDMLAGRLDDALRATYEPASGDSTRSVAATALSAAGSLVLTGRAVEAWDLAQRGIDARLAQEDSPLTLEFGLLIVAQIMAGTSSGRFEDAVALGRMAHAVAVEANTPLGQGFLGMLLGRCLLVQGSVAEADRWLRDAHVQFGLGNYEGAQRWCVGARVFTQAYLGRPDDASALSDAASRYQHRDLQMMEPEMVRGRAWALASTGDRSRARAAFDNAVDLAVRAGMLAHEIDARHDLVRLGWATDDDVAGLIAVADRSQGALADARAAHGKALLAEDPAGLLRTAETFGELDAHLFAAEAAAQAAVAARRVSDGDLARRALELTATHHQRCPGVQTPALVAIRSDVWRLTPREREVADLAASALSTRDIADRLFVSPRTVDNHLHRIYAKLGVDGRDDLVALWRHGDA